MELGVRKILPRVHPSAAERETDGSAEPSRNGTGTTESSAAWKQAVDDETGPKRKRQTVEDPVQSQALPSLRHMLTTPARPYAVELEKAGPARLTRASHGAYIQDGPFKFLSHFPSREFPPSITSDTRELSFAIVEPELLDIFRRAWYLRHHVRLKTLQGEQWMDHIFFNDCYGVDTVLHTWTSRYDPGTLQYPVSMLYKYTLWLFFNRSVQVSKPSAGFAQVVEDGLHFYRMFDTALGPRGDRSVLLVPLFILGACAFYPGQQRDIWEAFDRLDPSYTIDAVAHAVKSLERLWEMMANGRVDATWDWENHQAHESTMAQSDRSLIELLWDPLIPLQQPQPQRVRSPETYNDFDASRFRAVGAPPPAPPHPEPIRPREEVEFSSPPHARSPPRHTNMLLEGSDMRLDGHHDTPAGHVEIAAGPRPFVAPLPPSMSYQSNSDVIQVLHRKSTKTKSSVPPCPVCGKELKNPSDAQKHSLQHSKPFRCREPGCTRTQGFATENDLQRHRKSVHGASPRIGNKIGYICAACPEPSDGTTRKWWPRLDNFKAHIRRKHADQDEDTLIQASASARRPGDISYHEDSHTSSIRWPEERRHESSLRRSTIAGDSMDPSDMDPEQSGYQESQRTADISQSEPTQGENENSDGQSRSPKSESDVSVDSAEGDGDGDGDGEAMDVSPDGDGEEGEGED